jgi:putative transposase
MESAPALGYRRLWILLRREGWGVNHKRVRRLYRLEGLPVRMRVRRRKHMARHRGPAPVPTGLTERWAMDFVHDALAHGLRQVAPVRLIRAVPRRF